MTNIILCGGNGTRLWPISRTLMPKQFVKLFSNKSLFQLTVERNSKVCKSQFIVSNIVKVIPSNINWSDVGSFDAIFEELPKE